MILRAVFRWNVGKCTTKGLTKHFEWPLPALSAKAIQSLALTLEGIHNVHGSHRLATGMLGVGDRITDNILQKDLEDTASLLINKTRDALDTATTGHTADGGLGNALDVVTKDLAVTLGATLSEALASFSTACILIVQCRKKLIG